MCFSLNADKNNSSCKRDTTWPSSSSLMICRARNIYLRAIWLTERQQWWLHSCGSDLEHSSVMPSSSLRCLLSRPALFFETEQIFFFFFYYLGLLVINDQTSCLCRFTSEAGCELCRKKKLYSVFYKWQHVLGSCQAAVVLYIHIFHCMHEQDQSSPMRR